MDNVHFLPQFIEEYGMCHPISSVNVLCVYTQIHINIHIHILKLMSLHYILSLTCLFFYVTVSWSISQEGTHRPTSLFMVA